MYNYQESLKKTGEIGSVKEIHHSLVFVDGLPKLKPNELVVFENGELGQTLTLSKDKAEILLLSASRVNVGDKLTRTDGYLSINISDSILGTIIDPLGRPLDGKKLDSGQTKRIDIEPPKLLPRAMIKDPLETGIALVDLVIPISRGQRELIIGDRKTGKTQFFVRTILNQAKKGSICIYASIGKRTSEIREIIESVKQKGVADNTVIIATEAADAPGVIFMAPYTAMTIAEYFASKGKGVIVVLDDLSNHAIYYRQISLLAGRFPGRNSYPGDIFYIHSKLIERAGNFKTGSITCFPVAESIMGDLSGYIQTNLMSMTDGHIFFDLELANLGRHPAINPFLSVTRVGRVSQTVLHRDLNRQLSSFLIRLEELREFVHFGAELSEEVIQKLRLGDRILDFFNQPVDIVPINMSILVISMLWIGSWRDQKLTDMRGKIKKMIEDYGSDARFQKQMDTLIASSLSFDDFLNKLREGNYGQERYY